jgi:hypothetical protein
MTKFPRENGFSPREKDLSSPERPMKKIVCFILICVFSCENHRKTDDTPPVASAEKNTYEGRVPLDDQRDLVIILSMLPSGQVGEGIFELEEFVENGSTSDKASSFKGKYSTLYGEIADERIVQFHGTAHSEGLTRTWLSPGFKGNITDSRLKMIREEPFRTTDLTLKIEGTKLFVLDNQLQVVSREGEHNLVKRTSRPFTVEGYFRHNGDSADFFEINTGENWAITKYGDYRKAIRQYHLLASKKFEVTYLKGIGFSIRHINRDGREIDALVIRKVLQMTTAPSQEGQ